MRFFIEETYQIMLTISYRLIKRKVTFVIVAERSVLTGTGLLERQCRMDLEGLRFHSTRLRSAKDTLDLHDHDRDNFGHDNFCEEHTSVRRSIHERKDLTTFSNAKAPSSLLQRTLA